MTNNEQRLDDLLTLVRLAGGPERLPEADRAFYYAEGTRLLRAIATPQEDGPDEARA